MRGAVDLTIKSKPDQLKLALAQKKAELCIVILDLKSKIPKDRWRQLDEWGELYLDVLSKQNDIMRLRRDKEQAEIRIKGVSQLVDKITKELSLEEEKQKQSQKDLGFNYGPI